MIQKGTMRMHNYGTMGGLETIHSLGDLPIKNWVSGEWEAGALATSGPRMAETIVHRALCLPGLHGGLRARGAHCRRPLCRRGGRWPGV